MQPATAGDTSELDQQKGGPSWQQGMSHGCGTLPLAPQVPVDMLADLHDRLYNFYVGDTMCCCSNDDSADNLYSASVNGTYRVGSSEYSLVLEPAPVRPGPSTCVCTHVEGLSHAAGGVYPPRGWGAATQPPILPHPRSPCFLVLHPWPRPLRASPPIPSGPFHGPPPLVHEK